MKKVVALLAVVAFSFANVACDKKVEAPVVEETQAENAEVAPIEEVPAVVEENVAPVEGAAVVAPAEGAAVVEPAKAEEPAK